jgi:thiol:disulfide interchange protein DsbD
VQAHGRICHETVSLRSGLRVYSDMFNMQCMKRLACLVCLLLLALPASAANTTARLLLSDEVAKAGQIIWAGVQMRMNKGWHTYWRNAGESGAPTTIDWTLPAGVTAGPIHWPVPEKYVTTGLTTYVYHDEVVLLVPLTLADTLAPGPQELSAKVAWLECEQICVSGKGNVSATVTIGNESKPSKQAALIEAWKKKLPQVLTNASARAWWEAASVDDSRPVVIEWDLPDRPAEVDFFSYASSEFEVGGATERLASPEGKVQIRKLVKKLEGDWPKTLAGVLVSRRANDEPPRAIEVKLPITAPVAKVLAAAPLGSILAMLGFAFLGGLFLNIMPCVLPVIALKVLGFVNQAQETPERVRRLGVIYGAGVLVSFLVLAGLAIAVQQAGGRAGWSTAFQNPQFRVLITILMTLVALNLFGLFEITLGGGAMGAASQLASKQGSAGAFFNGVLATVLATPCTAPFLGVAMGFAFTQPPFIIVLMFLAVGLGLAAPFVLLCWHPAWLKFLPKPGAWMERFKIAMGFPMLATAMWLFWLTGTRLGKTGVLWLGLFLVLLSLAAWIWGEFVQRGTRRKGLAIAICLLLLGIGYGGILEKQLQWRESAAKKQEGIDWKTWSPEAVERARREGHPVLVDFTADTCLNCQVNKITSLEIESTRAKLKEIDAVPFLADFTDEDPAIARELQRYGRAGVPLVLVYPKDVSKPPIMLPAVLTPSIVLEALDKAADSTTDPKASSTAAR